MKITDTYITFGVKYKENPGPGDERHPAGMFGEGYATIQGPDREFARLVAHNLFDSDFAFDYAERPRADLYPAGEILRVNIIQREELESIRRLIEDTYEAADGDSNDHEIAVLQEARDALAQMIGEVNG